MSMSLLAHMDILKIKLLFGATYQRGFYNTLSHNNTLCWDVTLDIFLDFAFFVHLANLNSFSPFSCNISSDD